MAAVFVGLSRINGQTPTLTDFVITCGINVNGKKVERR